MAVDQAADPDKAELCSACAAGLEQDLSPLATDYTWRGREFQKEKKEVWIAHHASLESLSDAARGGCCICAQIWEEIRDTQAEIVTSRYTIRVTVNPKRVDTWDSILVWFSVELLSAHHSKSEGFYFYAHPLLPHIRKKTGCLGRISNYFLPSQYLTVFRDWWQTSDIRVTEALGSLERFLYNGSATYAPVLGRPRNSALSSTGSLETLGMVRHWLQKCLKEHRNCVKVTSSVTFAPSRLVDVGDLQSTHWRLSTLLDRSIETPLYLTLSHRWGTGTFTKLKMSNCDEMRRGQPLSDLPKSFQDAIEVTKQLGQRYIWIDSLCIVQDSYEDWLHESAMMQDIYAHSLMNIAALNASDTERGSFVDRHPGTIRNKISLRWKGHPDSPHRICRRHLWERSVSQLSVNSRGWVFQERILAPRTIYFGKTQVFWECSRLRACESVPEGLPPWADAPFRHWRSGLRGSDKSRIYELWTQHVEAFSECEFSRLEDKLVALSGVAKLFESALHDTYLAGLWRHSLKNRFSGLDWQIKGSPKPRISVYIAPSWSWASVDSPVKFKSCFFSERTQYLYDVLEADVSTIGSSNTGPVTGGYLKVRCLLFGPFTMSRRSWTQLRSAPEAMTTSTDITDDSTITHDNNKWIETRSGREYEPKIRIHWDSEHTPSNTILYCMPTVYEAPFSGCDASFAALILCSIENSETRFTRVGYIEHLYRDFAGRVGLAIDQNQKRCSAGEGMMHDIIIQ